MKILSQDKKICTTLNHVGIKEVVKEEKKKVKTKTYTVSNQIDGMYGIPLGTYQTEERAKAIVKEIYNNSLDRYEMPQE